MAVSGQWTSDCGIAEGIDIIGDIELIEAIRIDVCKEDQQCDEEYYRHCIHWQLSQVVQRTAV